MKPNWRSILTRAAEEAACHAWRRLVEESDNKTLRKLGRDDVADVFASELFNALEEFVQWEDVE
jgi:hypothetical protein